MLGTILLMIGLGQVHCYKSGPPPSACDSMNPTHPGSPQTTPSPYTVSFSKSSYLPNEQIQVTLQGSPDFKGFLIQPRKSSSDPQTYGSITIPADYRNPCVGVPVALSQTTNSAGLKSSVTFNWTAPSTDEGSIVFVYTVVQSYNTYWVKQVSAPITNPGGTGTTTGASPTQSPTTTTGILTTSTITKNEGCGSKVGCFHDCDGDAGCNFQLTFADNGGDSVAFTMSCLGTGDRYCTVGMSKDGLMGDDSVFGCVSDGGTVEARHFYNVGKNSEPLDDPTFGLTLLSSSHQDGIITCSFSRKKSSAQVGPTTGRKKRAASDDSTFFNLEDDWTIVYADGPYFSGFLGKHEKIPKVSCIKVDFQGFADLSICSPTLVFLHATFMSVAWMFFASVGLFTARYYKSVWPEGTELCGQKRWFSIHRLTMVVVVVCNIAGFIVIFVYAEGYSKISGSGFKKSHPVLGIIVMALTLINPIMALFRPGPGTKFRPVFNIAHMGVGHLGYILAILNLISGTLLATTNVPPYIRTILYVFGGWVILIHVSLTLHDCLSTKGNATKVDDSKPQTLDNGANNHEMQPAGKTSYSLEAKKGDAIQWKTILLVVNGVVLLGFTLAIVIIVWTQRDN